MNDIKFGVDSYEMYTKAGDKSCQSLVAKIVKKINGNKRVTKDEILGMIREGMEKIAVKHGEVYDTEPEGWIVENVSKALKNVGYDFNLSRWDL